MGATDLGLCAVEDEPELVDLLRLIGEVEPGHYPILGKTVSSEAVPAPGIENHPSVDVIGPQLDLSLGPSCPWRS